MRVRLQRAVTALALAALLVSACADPVARPRAVDTKNDTCASCRMAVSDARFAAQLVAPGEEPRLFDDVGCLRDLLSKGSEPLSGWTAFVADHRTKAWAPAASAVYTRVPTLDTPMGSHVIAHAGTDSREADPDARGGIPVAAGELFAKGLPGGVRGAR